MTQPARIRDILTSAAERQRAQRDAMKQTSTEIADQRVKESDPNGTDAKPQP